MILFALWWSSLLIGEGIFESFHTWLKAFYNCHNWPSRWFPTLIMRISHLIQTIQPDPQILTSAHERDSFSKKNNSNNKKNSCMNKAYFILINFPLTVAAMVPPARYDKWKIPWEHWFQSQLGHGLNSLRPLPACAILSALSIMNWVVTV